MAIPPADWDVQVFERDDYPSGALCLVPHNTDVTIHRVRVTPLAPGEVVDGSAPTETRAIPGAEGVTTRRRRDEPGRRRPCGHCRFAPHRSPIPSHPRFLKVRQGGECRPLHRDRTSRQHRGEMGEGAARVRPGLTRALAEQQPDETHGEQHGGEIRGQPGRHGTAVFLMFMAPT